MKKSLPFSLLCSLAFLSLGAFAPSSNGATILSNLAVPISTSILTGGLYQSAFVFTMGTTSYTVTDVILTLSGFTTAEDTVTLGFYTTPGGLTIGSLVENMITPISTNASTAQFTFLPSAPITLAANTTYWLLLDASSTSNLSWGLTSPATDPTGSAAVSNGNLFSSNDGASYFSVPSRARLAINGLAVPEPSRVCFLLTAALIWFSSSRRRALA